MKEKLFGPKVNLIGPLALNEQVIDYHLPTILIDAGTNHKLPFITTISIGDNDSSQQMLDIKLSVDKDASDFKHALELIPSSCVNIFAHGLMGGRLDHQLFIIGDTHHFLLDKKMIFDFYDEDSLRLRAYPPGIWELDYQGIFSLINLQQQHVILEGNIRYPLHGEYTQISPLSSHTLSNQAFGKFTLKNSAPLTVYFKHPALV